MRRVQPPRASLRPPARTQVCSQAKFSRSVPLLCHRLGASRVIPVDLYQNNMFKCVTSMPLGLHRIQQHKALGKECLTERELQVQRL